MFGYSKGTFAVPASFLDEERDHESLQSDCSYSIRYPRNARGSVASKDSFSLPSLIRTSLAFYSAHRKIFEDIREDPSQQNKKSAQQYESVSALHLRYRTRQQKRSAETVSSSRNRACLRYN